MTAPHRSDALRVGYVLKKFPRLSETFVVNELLGVERAGVAVTVFSLRPADDEPRHAMLDQLTAEVLEVPRRRKVSLGTMLSEVAHRHGADTADRLAAFMGMIPLDRQTSVLSQGMALADEVTARGLHHLHAHFVTVAAHTAHVAHVITGVTYSITAHAKDIYRHGIDRQLFGHVVEHSTTLVTVCDANEQHIRAGLLPGTTHPIVVIPNGLPDDVVEHLPAATRRGTSLLAVGRLVEKKGFDVLVDACAALRARGVDVSCDIAGGGDLLDELAARIERHSLGAEVRLLGPVPRERVMELMSRARVLAVPCVTGSDGNRDALPTVVLEAMLVGLPVVATPIGGIEEMVRDGHEGIIIPERDTTALADALERLLRDDVEWNRLSAAGPERVAQRFTQASTLPLLLAVFEGASGQAS